MCGGAAIGVLTVPKLASLLPQFTVGIQRVRWVRSAKTKKARWWGLSAATALGTTGGYISKAFEWTIPYKAKEEKIVRFELVADPMYHTTGADWKALSDIKINPPRKLQGVDFPITPYEIGCQITATDIPLGAVRFSLGGRRWEALLDGRIEDAIINESVPIILKCFKINQRGEVKKDPQDKKFLLWIVPDPASRLPIVSQEEDFKKKILPVWCSDCRDEIEGQTARVCQTASCKFSLCWSCSLGPITHPAEHNLAGVDMDF